MKCFLTVLLVTVFATGPVAAAAGNSDDPSQVLARRGNGVVTQDEFAARADEIPADIRYGVLRDRNRVRDVINTLLLRSQLAADAREASFDEQSIVINRMKLAAEAELANAWLKHYVAMQPEADYEALAFEYYQLHGAEMRTEESIDVSHILISTKERDDAEAKDLADSVYQQTLASPVRFDELILEYSEDPSVTSNQGHFKGVKKGEMVTAFEQVAFALQAGEISEPVKTQYGYHIIRLDAHVTSTQRSFEAVRDQLIKQQRTKHEQRIQRDYLSGLTGIDVEMTEEALREMAKRQFGEEELIPEATSANSE